MNISVDRTFSMGYLELLKYRKEYTPPAETPYVRQYLGNQKIYTDRFDYKNRRILDTQANIDEADFYRRSISHDPLFEFDWEYKAITGKIYTDSLNTLEHWDQVYAMVRQYYVWRYSKATGIVGEKAESRYTRKDFQSYDVNLCRIA